MFERLETAEKQQRDTAVKKALAERKAKVGDLADVSKWVGSR